MAKSDVYQLAAKVIDLKAGAPLSVASAADAAANGDVNSTVAGALSALGQLGAKLGPLGAAAGLVDSIDQINADLGSESGQLQDSTIQAALGAVLAGLSLATLSGPILLAATAAGIALTAYQLANDGSTRVRGVGSYIVHK